MSFFIKNFIEYQLLLLFSCYFKAIKIGRYTIHHKTTNITEAKEAKKGGKEKSEVSPSTQFTSGEANSCNNNDDLITASNLLDMAVSRAIVGSSSPSEAGNIHDILCLLGAIGNTALCHCYINVRIVLQFDILTFSKFYLLEDIDMSSQSLTLALNDKTPNGHYGTQGTIVLG